VGLPNPATKAKGVEALGVVDPTAQIVPDHGTDHDPVLDHHDEQSLVIFYSSTVLSQKI